MTKFETMVASGGCERFRQEYMQKLKERANQKETQAPARETELEKQTTAPVKGSTGL